jgi:hypothetical protein
MLDGEDASGTSRGLFELVIPLFTLNEGGDAWKLEESRFRQK